eukprot:SAG31_NODE_2722_length_5188_cov_6.223030_6_plen_73_part_00
MRQAHWPMLPSRVQNDQLAMLPSRRALLLWRSTAKNIELQQRRIPPLPALPDPDHARASTSICAAGTSHASR